MAEQLGLDLPVRTARGRDDFLVAPSNAMAVAMIENWRNWTSSKMILSGPEGAGKTHLTHVWADAAQARIIQATTLKVQDVPELAKGCIAVEDVPDIANNPEAQTALFHLHNMVLAEGQTLLLTGTGAVAHWGITLPDLESRLRGTLEATIDAPDDALLSAVLVKLLSDRQLMPPPEVVPYLLKRMDRSFSAANRIVGALDRESLARQRPITRSLAALVLDNRDTDTR
ncbi:HdaA/DnaA family protein [Sulfitobacter donghicola]|uniref:Chromosomal replication initiator, DnaA n=1 Tax=Sulfitobacter donghicola DSW-25 = KCTC 12864 = JCM 14565 TaxID=1300350 RepID=A0A073IJI5_9RHOB|nr:DnaA/Hda family protein [Sulfitobacter donghicola]KEJ89929.1 chromosomal replication initiator, DnaA [Sulfitobacter donghicola DSW-25 = KCTC 12864 = JCM 14565]KIN66946.1 Chromosomal replication initiator, DnaA [Sulfitobacter donghicola DSW-25 = KCTC 12864 = JCM 14565]